MSSLKSFFSEKLFEKILTAAASLMNRSKLFLKIREQFSWNYSALFMSVKIICYTGIVFSYLLYHLVLIWVQLYNCKLTPKIAQKCAKWTPNKGVSWQIKLNSSNLVRKFPRYATYVVHVKVHKESILPIS